MPNGGSVFCTRNANYCHDVLCPVCSLVNRMKKNGIQFYKIGKELESDYDFYPITLTIPNCKLTAEALSRHLDLLVNALKKLMSWKFWKDVVSGCFWAIEVTAGNGFHPHIHMVVAVLKDENIFSEDELRENWTKAIVRCGFKIKEKDELQIHIAKKIEQKRIITNSFVETERDGNKYSNAVIGQESDSVSSQLARWIMYCTKPMHNAIFGRAFSSCENDVELDDFVFNYDEKFTDRYPDKKECAKVIEPLSIVLQNRRLLGATGVFRIEKRRVKDQSKRKLKKLRENNSDEETTKYLMRWNGWLGQYFVSEHVSPDSPFQALMDNPQTKKTVTATMMKELPENVQVVSNKQLSLSAFTAEIPILPQKQPVAITDKIIHEVITKPCEGVQSVNQGNQDMNLINRLLDWIIREFPIVIGTYSGVSPRPPELSP